MAISQSQIEWALRQCKDQNALLVFGADSLAWDQRTVGQHLGDAGIGFAALELTALSTQVREASSPAILAVNLLNRSLEPLGALRILNKLLASEGQVLHILDPDESDLYQHKTASWCFDAHFAYKHGALGCWAEDEEGELRPLVPGRVGSSRLCWSSRVAPEKVTDPRLVPRAAQKYYERYLNRIERHVNNYGSRRPPMQVLHDVKTFAGRFLTSEQGTLLACQLLEAAGEEVEAQDLAREFVSCTPCSAQLALRVGRYLEQKREFEQAVTVFGESLRRNRSNLVLSGALAKALYAAGLKNQSVDVLYQSASKAGTPEPFLQLGTTLYGMGRKEAACDAYAQAIRAQPESPRGYLALGRTLAYMDRNQDASRVLMRAIKAAPDDTDVVLEAAGLLALMGDIASAVMAITRCARASDDPRLDTELQRIRSRHSLLMPQGLGRSSA